jgi:cytidylate kinase
MTRKIQQIIEQQLSTWRMQQKSRPAQVKGFVPPNVICISNEFGSNGVQIARETGELLGVPVYDREIVEQIATDAQVGVETVETLDQTAQNQLRDYVAALFRERNFDQSDYVLGLTRAIMGLWGHGTCVLLGRGATHIVYRKHLLALRLRAPEPHRVRFVQNLEGLDEKDALRRVRRMDAERAGFIRRHFGEDINDPLLYDLVVNTAGLQSGRCARLIVDAFRRKFGDD